MKSIAENIRVVLFDHDDTLVGTIGTKWEQHKQIARTHYNKELTDEEIKLHWGKPLNELLCLLYDTADVDEAMAHVVATHTNFEKKLFEATIPTLRHLKDSGKLLGIITATSRRSFEHDLSHHGVPKELLDFTQTADDTSFHKPDARVFEPVLEWLAKRDITANEVLYIGDGLHDMKAALGAGFNFLGVETGLVTSEQFEAAGVKSLPSIADLINS